MKTYIRTAVAVCLMLVSDSVLAQDRKAERRARREQRRIENAVRDSLRKVAADEEMINVGYGSVKKKDMTMSVSKVNVTEKGVSGYSDIGDYLRGKVPGLVVTKVGDEYKYKIRGTNTINGSTDPLFVVDGATVNSISYLDPNNIASVEVLKDAASTSMYGSRGANGVILITTKK